MTGEERSFSYGKHVISYRLVFAERKSMQISVYPDCSVVVKAPAGSAIEMIEDRLRKRVAWIMRQINYFNQFSPKTPERSYVGGETHLYLGRQYRLRIINEIPKGVKLSGGYFIVRCGSDCSPEVVRNLMEEWYREKALLRFKESMERCLPLFGMAATEAPSLRAQRMQKRWGSLSQRGTITLNTSLVRAPKECIDYVLIHELCHLKHRSHTAEFFNFLEAILPEWKDIKHRLELALM